MRQITCPNCGHDINPSDTGNTRDTKAMRESLLNNWFEGLKKNGAWKGRVKESGKLQVKNARRELYVLEMKAKGLPPEDNGMWDENYFKPRHWSYQARQDFENWIQAELSMRPDRGLFGDLIEDLEIPILKLESLNVPEEAMDVIVEFAQKKLEEKREAQAKIKTLQSRINTLDEQVLRLQTVDDHQAQAATEEHYENSIRTIRYGAGMDIDLSQEELIKELRESNQE
jgi:hypothetical protein